MERTGKFYRGEIHVNGIFVDSIGDKDWEFVTGSLEDYLAEVIDDLQMDSFTYDDFLISYGGKTIAVVEKETNEIVAKETITETIYNSTGSWYQLTCKRN